MTPDEHWEAGNDFAGTYERCRVAMNYRLPAHLPLYHCITKYCGVPPIIPHFDRDIGQQSRPNCIGITLRGQPCIACGEVHNTSDDCGVEKREPAEPSMQALMSKPVGYRLTRAQSMGHFDDC